MAIIHPSCQYVQVILAVYGPVDIICTTSPTFNNSTFCPHSVFMCFVWISEQTTIISLYNINWPVFITETECVYCAIRTGYLYIIQINRLESLNWPQFPFPDAHENYIHRLAKL